MKGCRKLPGKRVLALAWAMVIALPELEAVEQVLIFGDSLSKEYEIEFALDGYPSSVKNWIEILDSRRNDFFDYGSLSFYFDSRVEGHEYNWSIPGGKIEDFVEIVRGNTNEVFFPFREEREIIEPQLQSEVERFVLFVGGNDGDSVYATAYNGGDLSDWIAEFLDDTEEVLDWVLSVNPSLEVVLVGMPHVGITPKVKNEYPPDPVKTANATAAYAQLNAGLESLAAMMGIGFVDIFNLTLELLGGGPLCYQGVEFINAGDTFGDLEYVWLGGGLSDDFHPNTIGTANVANAILAEFNDFYGSDIEWLSTEEILDDLLGMNPDVSFASWLACYGFAGGSATDDPDADGVCHLVEFGLGMDPRKADRERLPKFSAGPDGMGGSEIRLNYRPRLDRSSSVLEVAPQSSGNLEMWTDAGAGQISNESDGSVTVRFPAMGGSLYERVNVRLLP